MDSYHAYHVAACDYGWENLLTVDGALKLTTNSAEWEMVKKAAEKVGWDGKFQSEPCLFFLPHEESFETGFAWKQENNGDLIVVSPIELLWLRARAEEYDEQYFGEFDDLSLREP